MNMSSSPTLKLTLPPPICMIAVPVSILSAWKAVAESANDNNCTPSDISAKVNPERIDICSLNTSCLISQQICVFVDSVVHSLSSKEGVIRIFPLNVNLRRIRVTKLKLIKVLCVEVELIL